MGKVIINEHNATQTASKNSSSAKSAEAPGRQSQVNISRFHEPVSNVGVKMSTKSKATTTARITVNDTQDERRGAEKAANAPKSSKSPQAAKAQPVAQMNGRDVFGLPEGKNGAAVNAPRKVMTEAKIVERTQVRVNGGKTDAKLAGTKLDPELALLANRTSTAERQRVDMSRSGKSMSGMIGGTMRRPGASRAGMSAANSHAGNTSNNARVNTTSAGEKPKEEDLRFTKFKSVLIGVGVAVVVAVVGFAAIGIFGSKKNMCTVLFESNGGSQVAGTEIVCGRTIKRPADPTKEGFSFEGWTFEGEDFDFANTPLYKNATLVARWKADENVEIVKVTLDPNGGTISMNEIEIAKGKKLNPNSLSAPSQPGYVFEEWYLGDKPYDFEQPVEGDITLRAEWSKQPTNNNENNNQNQNNNNNNSTPAPAKVSSIESAGDLTLEIGKSTTIQVNVLPSAANFNLEVTSSDGGKVACSMSGSTAMSCTANAAGEVTVKIRDTISGVSTQFKVTVPADDVPPVSGGEDKPPVTGPGGESGGSSSGSGNEGGGSGNTGAEGGNTEGGDSGNIGGDNPKNNA